MLVSRERRYEYRRCAERGVRNHIPRYGNQLDADWFPLAHDFWARLLRRRDDSCRLFALRPGPLRGGFQAESAAIRSDDCSGDFVQQDGARLEKGVRPDGRAALGYLDGFLCKRRRIQIGR